MSINNIYFPSVTCVRCLKKLLVLCINISLLFPVTLIYVTVWSKTIWCYKVTSYTSNDFGEKRHCQKIKYFINISIFIFFAAILKICKLGHKDIISKLANISFWIQHTKLLVIGISKSSLHKMPALVNFS